MPKGRRTKNSSKSAQLPSSSSSDAEDPPEAGPSREFGVQVAQHNQKSSSPFVMPAWLTDSSAVHVLNPDIATTATSSFPSSASHVPPAPLDSSNQQGLAESNAVPAQVVASTAPIAHDAPHQAQIQRRRSLSADALSSNLQQEAAAPQGNQLPHASADDIIRALRSAHSSDVLRQVTAALNRSEVILIDDSPPRLQAPPRVSTPVPAAGQSADVSGNQHFGGGVKRLQPGDVSTSSSSVASSDHHAIPSASHEHTATSASSAARSAASEHAVQHGVTEHPAQPASTAYAAHSATTPAAPAPAPPSASVLSPSRRSTSTRCPVCLLHPGEWQEGHNPMHCIYVRGPRSSIEDQQVEQIHATRRMLQSLGGGGVERVNYAGLDSSSTSPSPSPSDYLPSNTSAQQTSASDRQTPRTFVNPTTSARVAYPHQPPGGNQQTSAQSHVQQVTDPRPGQPELRAEHIRTQVDPRVRAVRASEREAYAAGVDTIRSSEERSEDTYASECSSSEYQPSSLGRSSSTGDSEPRWVSTFRQAQESAMNSMRSELTTLMAQMTQLAQSQVNLQQQFQRQQLPQQLPMSSMPPMAPMPFAIPQAPYMPLSGIPFMPHLSVAPSHPYNAPDELQNDPVPPNTHAHRVNFADMVGVNSPSMMHTARPRSGMRGAPDLAPEDIGNVHKFNEFLKQYSQYAATARDQGSTWSTVAGLLSRYAEDLAIAFTACAMKRGERVVYTTDAVLQLSDAQFEKLYVEACFPSVEFPSQVLEALETTLFRRQHTDEANPLHPVMRAAEAFRVQLRLLPALAVQQCSEEGIMNAFFRLLFGDEAKRRRMDFQQCATWEQARTALITRATVHPSWFGDCLKERVSDSPAPKIVAATSSVSSAHSGSSASDRDTKRPASWYDKRASELLKSGALEGVNTEGLTPKQIVKTATKLRFKAKLKDDLATTSAAAPTSSAVADALAKQQEQFKAAMAAQATETGKMFQALQQSIQRSQQVRSNSRDGRDADARSRDLYRPRSDEGQRYDDSRPRSNEAPRYEGSASRSDNPRSDGQRYDSSFSRSDNSRQDGFQQRPARDGSQQRPTSPRPTASGSTNK
jgi:hypothetical protein